MLGCKSPSKGAHQEVLYLVYDLTHLFPDTWSSTVYTYIFHRRIYDGTFHIAYENKDLILPGLFGAKNETVLDSRISELLDVAERRLPARPTGIRIRPEPCHVDPCRVPLLAKVSSGAIESVSKVCLISPN